MIPLPTPQQLRYLTALAEFQHFGRAADACAVTQSTLSAGLLALERQMDARILDRDSGKRVMFTPLGRELVERARHALQALTAMVETADASRSPMSGRLRLGVIPTVSPFLLPRLMPALRTAFPALRLFLREDTTRNLVEDLGNGRLDLALLALPCACAGTDTMKVARDPFFAALPPGHKLASQSIVTAAALAAESLLLLEDGHCLRDQALSACGVERDDGPGGEYAATSLHTLAQMVAGGLGVTVLPELAIKAGLTDGTGIVLRPIAGDGAYRTLGFAWRPGAPRAAEFRALAPVLAGVVAG
ncbi:MAG: LysR substrate-binding domain-containing protein [Acetobacteraceae bacterium]|nr:LysR substrate-binding domain-containing protein [Acetobacteraceae bacterium]